MKTYIRDSDRFEALEDPHFTIEPSNIMKDKALDAKLKDIQQEESRRKFRAAVHIRRKDQKQSNSRKAVIQRAIKRLKQDGYARERERQRPTFGTTSRRGALLHPLP